MKTELFKAKVVGIEMWRHPVNRPNVPEMLSVILDRRLPDGFVPVVMVASQVVRK